MFEIRDATTADAAAMAEVWLCAHEGDRDDAIIGIVGELKLAQRGAGRVVSVAISESNVIAYGRARWYEPEAVAAYRNCPAGWWLSGSVVLPAYRRRGIGRALIRARLERLACVVHSKVDVSNGASLAMHQSCGFSEVTRDFSAPGTRDDGEPMILLAEDASVAG